MPDLNIDNEGYLIDGENNRVKIGDEDVKVTNAQTQDQVNTVVESRLKREREKLDSKIKTLEAQATKTPELERMLEELKADRTALEEKLANAQQAAEQEVAQQLTSARKDADGYKAALEQERQARVRDQVTNLVLRNAGDRFINPAKDLVPDLLAVHKREPAKDPATGQRIDGQFVDLFKVALKNDKGETVEEFMPVDKAIDTLAARDDYQHYVRGTGHGGSGGSHPASFTSLKRSAMSTKQKSDFISRHGLEAFQNLPQ